MAVGGKLQCSYMPYYAPLPRSTHRARATAATPTATTVSVSQWQAVMS